MKYFYPSLLFFVLPFLSISQNSTVNHFSSQLKKVIANAPSGFDSYRKDLVQQKGSDIVYASKMNLQGTTDNKINSFSDGSSYMATIGSVPSEKEAKAMVQKWKGKLLSILGKGYEVVPYDNSKEQMKNEGYILMGAQNSLTIDYIKYDDEQNYKVYLIVLNK